MSKKEKEVKGFVSFLQRIDELFDKYCGLNWKDSKDFIQFNKEFRSVFLLCLKELKKKRFKSDVVDSGDYPTIDKKDVVLWSDIIKILGKGKMREK